MNAPDAQETDRFRADLLRLCPEAGEGARIGLAVSGGPDSMALLALADAAFPKSISVATVDHQLRPESGEEAVMVSRACAERQLPHATLVPAAPIAGASLQAQAREVRYALLANWARDVGAACVLTAHHADDQAETFLMRAARGSGLAGLAGIRARQEMAGIAVVRPLIEWRRAELRAIARRSELPFVDDPANHDDRHDRARFRRLLETNEWLDPPNLARAAAHLAEADAGIRQMRDWLWQARALPAAPGEVRIDVSEFPRELRRRVARSAIGRVREAGAIDRPAWSDARGIEPLLDSLEAGKRGTVAGVLASAEGQIWRFRPAPPRRSR